MGGTTGADYAVTRYLAARGLTATALAEGAVFQAGLPVSTMSVVGAAVLGFALKASMVTGMLFLGVVAGSYGEAVVVEGFSSIAD